MKLFIGKASNRKMYGANNRGCHKYIIETDDSLKFAGAYQVGHLYIKDPIRVDKIKNNIMKEVSIENAIFPEETLKYVLYDTNYITGKPLTLDDFNDVKELYKFTNQYSDFKNDIGYSLVNNHNNNKMKIK